MNVTDVGHLSDDGDAGEDKMIRSAREQGMSVWDIADMFTKVFFDDSHKLNIQKPDIVCKATDHIKEMIELIVTLESKGFTYVAGGNVYFDVGKFRRYGDLALLDRQELKAGARIEVDAGKKDPRDFVLWFTNSKFEQQAMIWESPWGKGYPGWHIECSAMSRKYLGDQFDIHCGGVDHIPVHHTNEIAQTEAATGQHPWVNYWLHAEFLLMNKSKMSKSAGGTLTLRRLEELGYQPLDYRFFCLQANYRTQLSYSDEAMDAARTGRANLVEKVARLKADCPNVPQIDNYLAASGRFSGAASQLLNEFAQALADDLNVPKAFSLVWSVLKHEGIKAGDKLALLYTFDQVLGLSLADSALQAADVFLPAERQEIDALIAQRLLARQEKNWAESDRIRDMLKVKGILLVDGPKGTHYERI